MEIQPKLQMNQSQDKVDRPVFLASGEYKTLIEKGKGEILTVSEKALVRSVERANKAVEGSAHEFKYKLHEATNTYIVQVLTRDTHEVIHEIPSEKFIDLVEKLKELTVGAIIDEKW